MRTLHFSIDWLWPRRLRSWPLPQRQLLPAAAAAAAVRSCLSATQLQHRQRRIASGSGKLLPAAANLKHCRQWRISSCASLKDRLLWPAKGYSVPAHRSLILHCLFAPFFILKLISGFIAFEEESLSHNPHLFSVIQV